MGVMRPSTWLADGTKCGFMYLHHNKKELGRNNFIGQMILLATLAKNVQLLCVIRAPRRFLNKDKNWKRNIKQKIVVETQYSCASHRPTNNT